MARLTTRALALCAVLSWSVVQACGNWAPKHGGQMNNDSGEVAVELVSRGRDVVLHLEDHGQPIAASEARGNLKVVRNGAGWSLALKAGPENRLVAVAPATLRKGDLVTADLAFRNGSIAIATWTYGVEVDRRARFGATPSTPFR